MASTPRRTPAPPTSLVPASSLPGLPPPPWAQGLASRPLCGPLLCSDGGVVGSVVSGSDPALPPSVVGAYLGGRAHEVQLVHTPSADMHACVDPALGLLRAWSVRFGGEKWCLRIWQREGFPENLEDDLHATTAADFSFKTTIFTNEALPAFYRLLLQSALLAFASLSLMHMTLSSYCYRQRETCSRAHTTTYNFSKWNKAPPPYSLLVLSSFCHYLQLQQFVKLTWHPSNFG
jgi:hypothetical protein